MARVTARQAYTRARTKRLKTRDELNRITMQQNSTYAKRLEDLGIDIKVKMTKKRQTKSPSKIEDKPKKITDYFASTSRLEMKPSPRKTSKSSSCIGPGGVEIITLYESDCDDNNNNIPSIENDPHNVNRPHRRSDSNSSNITDVSFIGVSLKDLDIKFKVDEDIEIVEMLPPIPLRDHPVHEIDD